MLDYGTIYSRYIGSDMFTEQLNPAHNKHTIEVNRIYMGYYF